MPRKSKTPTKKFDSKSESKIRKRSPKRRNSNSSNFNNDSANDRYDTKLTTNDSSWYCHNESLAQAAGAVPFGYALGNKVQYMNSTDLVMPGVMSIEVTPCFGRALYMTDPINIAAVANYSFVRHQNSGHSNYDHPDLMMYYLAMGQAYSAHEWMKRMYGYLNTYSVTNRYIPKAYAKADNINFDDFIHNLPNLQYFINEIAVKLSAFAIPQNYDLFKRHRFMYSNIHMDAENARAALYMFVPSGFYKFDNTTNPTGTSLQWSTWNHVGTPYTFAQLKAYIEDLISVPFGDEDCGIMSGDVLKAYGSESIYTATPVDFDYSVVPVYDSTILEQIHNATVLGTVTAKPVAQTSAGVIQNQQLRPINTAYTNTPITSIMITSGNDTPDYKEVLEMTRLTASLTGLTGVSDNMLIGAGSEAIGGVKIWTYDYATDDFTVLGLPGYGYTISTIAHYKTLANQLQAITKFDYHPAVVIRDSGDSTSYVFGDVDNVTSLSKAQLENLHTTALLSLFGV